jgi:hypothetical protein
MRFIVPKAMITYMTALLRMGRVHRRQAIKAQPIFSQQAAAAAGLGSAPASHGSRGSKALRPEGGVRKASSGTLDKARLLLKRQKMDPALRLGLSAPSAHS